MSAEVMITDRNAVRFVVAPILTLLKRLRQIRTVEHLQRAGVTQNVCLCGAGQDRRVGVIGVEIVRVAPRKVVLKVARVDVRRHDKLPAVIQATGTTRALLRAAQRRQQQAGQDHDAGDDHQQLNQRERSLAEAPLRY